MGRNWFALFAVVLAVGAGGIALAQSNDHGSHQASGDHLSDARVAIELPSNLKQHMLANMRDHLLAVQEIQEALAHKQEDRAAQIAEQRLGMTSLRLHGAHEVGKHMPPSMREIGSGMHRLASRFAVEAQNAGVTGDIRPALAALAQVTAQCVACHAGYRLK